MSATILQRPSGCSKKIEKNHLGFDRRLTVEQRVNGEVQYEAPDYSRPIKHFLAAGLFVTLAFTVIGYYGKTAMKQRAAMTLWEAVEKPEGNSNSHPPKMHSPAFWGVMVAFGIDHGDPVEQLSAVIGEPGKTSPVTWYLYMDQGINEQTSHPTWVVKSPDDFVMPGHVRQLEAKRYSWKGDYYYWPRPKGE